MARSRMMGIGTPSIHSRIPRPIITSYRRLPAYAQTLHYGRYGYITCVLKKRSVDAPGKASSRSERMRAVDQVRGPRRSYQLRELASRDPDVRHVYCCRGTGLWIMRQRVLHES